MNLKGLLICFILAFNSLFGQSISNKIFSTQLQTISGETFNFSELKKNKGSILVFLLPDCPACESYSKTLNDLNKKYKADGFQFYGIFPGKYNTLEEMNLYKRTYKINFPLLQDPDNKLVQLMNATVVPSVFFINQEGNTLYKGRIDDWMYALGKKKAIITKHDLREALESVKTGTDIKVKETVAIGCILESD